MPTQVVLEISTRKLDNYQFIFKFVKPIGITNQHPFSDYILYIYIYIYIYYIYNIYIYIYIIYISNYIKLTSSFIGTFSRSGMTLHCLAVAKALWGSPNLISDRISSCLLSISAPSKNSKSIVEVWFTRPQNECKVWFYWNIYSSYRNRKGWVALECIDTVR